MVFEKPIGKTKDGLSLLLEVNTSGVGNLKAKFELFFGRDEQWYFHLKANNGRIIAQSEGYTRKAGALKGIEAIRTVAVKAKIIEVSD